MTTDINKMLKDRFYVDFEIALDEWLFEYMTENIHHHVEKVVCAAKGITYEDYLNEAEEGNYDLIWHDACEISQDLIHELKRQYDTGEVYKG